MNTDQARTLWKESHRAARVAHSHETAPAWRHAQKLLALSSDARYAQKMEIQATAHAEIAPQLRDLANAQQALENLSLA